MNESCGMAAFRAFHHKISWTERVFLSWFHAIIPWNTVDPAAWDAVGMGDCVSMIRFRSPPLHSSFLTPGDNLTRLVFGPTVWPASPDENLQKSLTGVGEAGTAIRHPHVTFHVRRLLPSWRNVKWRSKPRTRRYFRYHQAGNQNFLFYFKSLTVVRKLEISSLWLLLYPQQFK